MQINQSDDPNLERLRERLHNMSDKALRRFGRGAMELCSDDIDPSEEFVVQLREARAEWQRRHSCGTKLSNRALRLPRLS
jgi:hypothetical protein